MSGRVVSSAAMAISIVEIHPASSPKLLNDEWFIVENRGDKLFSTRNCTLSVARKGSKKKRDLGTMDPGFKIAPGERVRVITGNPGRKAHGKPPEDGTANYHLFLNAPAIAGPGCVLSLSLRTHLLAAAEFEPSADGGVVTVS